MIDYVSKDLGSEEASPFHRQMLRDSKALVDMSRTKMGTFYNRWDQNDMIYRGETIPDAQDKKAMDRKEPIKMVVPLSYSQTQTFISFCYSLYTQRERMFELIGMSEEDQKPAKIGEAFLQRDLWHNTIEARLYQFLLDIARFSVGVIKTSWVRETQKVRQVVSTPGISFLGFSVGGKQIEVESVQTKFLGNKITNISPYRFFPDTRLPLCRFQEGEFVASEDEFSYVSLKQMEKEGVVSGVDFIKPMSTEVLEKRGTSRFSESMGVFEKSTMTGYIGQSKGNILITEIQRVIVPKNYMVDGKPLGDEDYPIKYVVWYANDNRVIKCEPLNYLHNEFTYDVGEYNPDMHNTVNMSLADSIDQLQSVLSWFINSHITSVRKVISNHYVVDPDGIEMKDLQERNPVIRLKPGSAGRGVDRFIKQLEVSDVTARHVEDARYIQDLVQLTTGINDNLLGQFHSGRRSATEARNVTSSAAARVKMIAEVIYRTALEPMARKMLSNLRDGLDEQQMVRLVGLSTTVESGAGFVKADKNDLLGNYDFEIFDGTLPSEKIITAQVLQDVLVGLMSNPEAAIALQLDPRAITLEMMELRGVRNPERFTLKAPLPVPGQPSNVTAMPGQPSPSNEPNQPPQTPAVEGFSGITQ